MTTAAASDEVLLARVLPVLKRLETPVTCIELSRLVKGDSSQLFRVLSKCPSVNTVRGEGLTTFAWAL